MPTDPHALWNDLGALWSRALTLASDAAIAWAVRGRAASLCRALAFEVAEDDALAVRAVGAASACVECFPVVQDLLIAAREVAVDKSCVLAPSLELCREADAACRHESVVVTLLELLECDAFSCDVPAAWLVRASAVSGEGDYWLRRLVRRWFERFGTTHEGLRAVVRDRADLWFSVHKFRVDVLRALHAAEPTAAGWVALASRRGEMQGGPLGMSFGDRHADAVAALREALLRALPDGTHAVLERWLRELAL